MSTALEDMLGTSPAPAELPAPRSLITVDQAALLALAEANPTPRPEPERDQWGRYKLRHPDTGKPQSWTRATTMAGAIADRFNLEKWAQRMTALGLAARPDLVAELASYLGNPDDQQAKSAINSIVEVAQAAAGSKLASSLGTAIHTVTEHHDLGTGLVIPQPWASDVAAYEARMTSAGIERPHEWVERIVLLPELGVAGTLDRIGTCPVWPLPRIMDVKTGRDLRYSWLEISIQLALYARSSHIWDADAGGFQPMPAVDQQTAVVIHMPVGKAECTLYEVDIEAGWKMAQACHRVREWRKRKDLARPLSVPRPPARTAPIATTAPAPKPAAVEVSPPADRTEWVKQRMDALRPNVAAQQALAKRWPVGTPPRPPWTDEQIDAIDAALQPVESVARTPFPEQDPATPITHAALPPTPAPPAPGAPDWDRGDEGPDTTADQLAIMRALVQALAADRSDQLRGWAQDANRHDAPWGAPTSARRLAIAQAAHACLTGFWDTKAGTADPLTRAAVAWVTDTELDPHWRTGAVLGSLTTGQAQQLQQLAEAAASDPSVVAELAATFAAPAA